MAKHTVILESRPRHRVEILRHRLWENRLLIFLFRHHFLQMQAIKKPNFLLDPLNSVWARLLIIYNTMYTVSHNLAQSWRPPMAHTSSWRSNSSLRRWGSCTDSGILLWKQNFYKRNANTDHFLLSGLTRLTALLHKAVDIELVPLAVVFLGVLEHLMKIRDITLLERHVLKEEIEKSVPDRK